MRSLFAKILLWFGCTLAIFVVGSAFLSALNINRNASDSQSPGARLLTFQLEEARAAYETGGRPALELFLENLHRIYDARGILTDEQGRDMLTGEDRAALVDRARRRGSLPFVRAFDSMTAPYPDDGHYWFFFIVPSLRPGSWFLMPEHLFMIGVAVLLCYWLAMHLTSPVRALQQAGERFGEGGFSGGAGWERGGALGG